MHFGNMKFKQKQREEQAEPDGTEGSWDVIFWGPPAPSKTWRRQDLTNVLFSLMGRC